MSSALDRATILCFGDSLTQRGFGGAEGAFSTGGWLSSLARAYQRKADVLSRGYGGYNTRGGVALLERVLPLRAHERHLLTTVFFGANDCAANAAQGVPLAEFEENLAAIVERAMATSCAVLVISPPPVNEELWPDRSNAALEAYAAAAARVVSARTSSPPQSPGASSIAHLDLRSVMLAHGGGGGGEPWRALLDDGLHLSPAGEAVASESILRAAIALTGHPDSLPWDAPHWRDVDLRTLESAKAAMKDDAIRAYRSAPPPPMPYLSLSLN